MAPKVIIIHPDETVAKVLTQGFNMRGIEVFHGTTPGDIDLIAKKNRKFSPVVAVIDLHMGAEDWLTALRKVNSLFPKARVLFTTDRSDPNLVLRAKNYGARHFLRAPFTEEALQHALGRMSASKKGNVNLKKQTKPPKIRVPLRAKIVLPYIFLALLTAIGAAYTVNRVTHDSVEERFINQLVDTGKLSTNWMVEEEDRLLGTLRLLSNTAGMAEAVQTFNSEALRLLTLPIVINAGEEAVEILNANGASALSVRREPGGSLDAYEFSRGEVSFLTWDFVQQIRDGEIDELGDKFSGLAENSLGTYFYVGGSLYNSNGEAVGVILVGRSVEGIVNLIRENTLGHITLYTPSGQMLSSTLFDISKYDPVLAQEEADIIVASKDESSAVRLHSVNDTTYQEILGAWEARTDINLGVIGTALPETVLVSAGEDTNIQILIMVVIAFTLVVTVGMMVANRVTRPLRQVMDASSKIAQGNFNVQVDSSGDDELAVLGYSFNRMVDGLKEGSLYRDLLGRTVSPEIREQLRNTLKSGDVRLEGQSAVATILMADVKGFTTISEKEDPATILNWLNELFSVLVPIISAYEGVVNELSGDSLFAFFGIFPRPMDSSESAYLACQAAVEILTAVKGINQMRKERGDPPFMMGIGVNTGPVTAGGLGTEDRLHYTIIGDSVNTGQRVESLAHQFDETAIMISKPTLIGIWDRRDDFNLEAHGVYSVKGKEEKLLVYRLWPAEKKLNPDKMELDLNMVE